MLATFTAATAGAIAALVVRELAARRRARRASTDERRALATALLGPAERIQAAAASAAVELDNDRPGRAERELDRAGALARDLLELASELMDEERPPLRAETTTLGLLIDDALEPAYRAGVPIPAKAQPDRAARLTIDGAKVRRLLACLGSEAQLAALDVRLDRHGAEARLVVEATLTTPAPSAVTARTTRLARLLGGAVEVSTTRLRVDVPARALESAPPAEPQDLGGGRALVVEDDQDGRAALALLLEDWGFEALEAGSGEEALDLALPGAPRIALLDLGLPGRDGLATRESLRAIDSRLPVVILSGDEARVERADGDPLTRWLLKPVDAEALEATLRELLAGRGAGLEGHVDPR